jgi:hypothetical protein
MTSDRHLPKQYEENVKDSCQYCRRHTIWQQIGNEKVCSHCGTRVYSPVLTLATPTDSNRRMNR